MSRRILIIDDEENIRRVTRVTLQAAGYEVSEAGDGERGLEAFGNGLSWDAVLLDPAPPPFRAFALAHIAFALAARHDVDELRRLRDEASTLATKHPQEPLRYLVPIIDALILVASEQWSEAAPALAQAAAVARRLGGSNEQHTLFDETAAYARRRAS